MKKAHRLDNITFSRIRMQSKLVDQMEAEGKDMIRFTWGEPDFMTPDYIKEAAKKAIDDNFTKYSDYCGPLNFRKAVCDKYERENGLRFEPDQVISTVGAAQAAYLVLTTFLDPGDEIIIPNPVFNIYKMIAGICGAVVREYALKEENEFQIDIEELEGLLTKKTKMIVICSPHNPLGSVLTRENMEAVAELVKDRDILICSDEIYERLTYDGVQAVSPANIPSLYEKTIIINGFSKAFAMTGWRFGYVITPKHLWEPLYLHAGFQVSGLPSFILEAGAVALNDEAKYGTVEKMRASFDERRKYLVKEINAMKHFSCLTPKGAFYVFMNIKKTGMTSDEFVDWLVQNYGVAVITGNCFGSEGEGFVRISYASSMEDIQKACRLLHEADQALG